jgi:hypothetical protein
LAKIWQFLLELLQKLNHSISFWDKKPFFTENWLKNKQKVVITSTPGDQMSLWKK